MWDCFFAFTWGVVPLIQGLKTPLSFTDTSSCEIKKNTHLSRLIEMTSLIVWDEAPMNNKCCIEALDRSLKDVLTSSINAHLVKPFGGKSVLG
jgi:hypothetical protein